MDRLVFFLNINLKFAICVNYVTLEQPQNIIAHKSNVTDDFDGIYQLFKRIEQKNQIVL